MVLLFGPDQKTIWEIVFPAHGPGWMCWMITPCFSAHFISFALMYSGPIFGENDPPDRFLIPRNPPLSFRACRATQ